LPDSGIPSAALFSVYERAGVLDLARVLQARGTPIFATEGTRRYLVEHGIAAEEVGALTGFPAILGGRVKTLHPLILGGILMDPGDPSHGDDAREHGIARRFSTVVVNLYPFEATVARGDATLAEAVEQIDIGGVSLIRAAAKNFKHVTVLVEPSQYEGVIAKLRDGGVDDDTRRRLATRAFQRTAEYDAAIGRYMEAGTRAGELPGSLALTLPLKQQLRYGENPQSRAAFYQARTAALPEQLSGKALSYNNMLDLDAALRLLVRAPVAAGEGGWTGVAAARVRAAVLKHTVPCGAAERDDAATALREAVEADAISAYGGVVAVDGAIDAAAADVLAPHFLEIVAAPSYTDDALARLRRKKNLRVIRYDTALPAHLARELRVRGALGGVLAEDDDPASPPEAWRVVSERAPTRDEWRDLAFAWDVVRHVKSNGVVIVRDDVTRGICAGQTNRVNAARIAGERAGATARGAACASDGYFPFPDGLEAAADAGCAAVIAPGGSIRDGLVIESANARGLALVFSTYRYFLH
jgi:phosphoribosylaminoimidazolecarboxamide formyltransferase/IMP cyclohydrolase